MNLTPPASVYLDLPFLFSLYFCPFLFFSQSHGRSVIVREVKLSNAVLTFINVRENISYTIRRNDGKLAFLRKWAREMLSTELKKCCNCCMSKDPTSISYNTIYYFATTFQTKFFTNHQFLCSYIRVRNLHGQI